MSMFSGLGNQISGFVTSKMPGGEAPPAEAAPVDPNDPNAVPPPAGENGEVPPEGGAMGFAKGIFGKALAVKDGAMQKAGEMGAGNIGNMAGGMMSQVTGMIPGMKKEEEVPDVAPQEGEYQEYTEEQQYYQEGQQYQGEYQQEYQQ